MGRGLRDVFLMVVFLLAALPSGGWAADRFITKGDGVVLDRTTGLQWQAEDTGVSMNWPDALAYCEALALGGAADWRLPNIKELRSLVDPALASPALDTDFFPGAGSDGYWSSSTRASSPNFAWYVMFGRGWVYTNLKTAVAFVRCVR